MGPDQMNSFIGEAEFLAKKVRPHPNITLFLGVCSKPTPAIVMEWMEGGSLDKWVYNHKKIISKRRMLRLIHGIARGVYHLHSENIVRSLDSTLIKGSSKLHTSTICSFTAIWLVYVVFSNLYPLPSP